MKLALLWMVFALSASACTLDQTPEASPFERCEPQSAGDEHLFYAENLTYIDPSPIPWETAEPAEIGLDAARLEAAADEAALSDTVASLLVIRRGKLVFERYFNGSDVSAANNLHSLSKSILSVVTGIAISEGLITLEMPLAEVLPAALAGPNAHLTVRHLLTMSAGLEYTEGKSESEWETSQDEAARSFVRAALGSARVAAPGEVFEYNTGLTQVLSAVIAEAAGRSLCDFATDRLLAPLGIEVDHWHVDPDGYHAGGHSTFMTPREVGRFGQVVLQGGLWEGKRLVAAEWLTKSLEVVWDLGCRPVLTGYGFLWWLNDLGGYRVWSASGFGGQDLLIVPDLDLVLVMTHTTDSDPADFEVVPALDLLQKYVIPAVTDALQQETASACAPRSTIMAIRPDASGRTVVLDVPTLHAPWSWSPDGARIALHANRNLNDEIYTMAADGSDFQRLTHDIAADIMPAYSPDGAAIVFARGHPAASDLYLMAADGSMITQLTDFAGYEHSPTWSPDGKSIAFIRGAGSATSFGESGALWIIAADGSELRLLLDQPVGAPDWSPAGGWIAFESRDQEGSRVAVIDLDSRVVTDLGPGSLPRWSADGSRLVFASNRAGNLDLFIMDANGANVNQLTTGPEIDTLPSWSPDGETILYVSIDVDS